jgi:hypothetical protein
MPVIEGGLAAAEHPQFEKSLAWAESKWGALDAAAWERVRIRFLREAIADALEIAASCGPSLSSCHWTGVQRGVTAVLAALNYQSELEAAAREIEAWSIPEGYDLWVEASEAGESETTIWAAKCAADAAYAATRPWVDHVPAEVARAVKASHQPDACAILASHLFVAISGEIGASFGGTSK